MICCLRMQMALFQQSIKVLPFLPLSMHSPTRNFKPARILLSPTSHQAPQRNEFPWFSSPLATISPYYSQIAQIQATPASSTVWQCNLSSPILVQYLPFRSKASLPPSTLKALLFLSLLFHRLAFWLIKVQWLCGRLVAFFLARLALPTPQVNVWVATVIKCWPKAECFTLLWTSAVSQIVEIYTIEITRLIYVFLALQLVWTVTILAIALLALTANIFYQQTLPAITLVQLVIFRRAFTVLPALLLSTVTPVIINLPVLLVWADFIIKLNVLIPVPHLLLLLTQSTAVVMLALPIARPAVKSATSLLV